MTTEINHLRRSKVSKLRLGSVENEQILNKIEMDYDSLHDLVGKDIRSHKKNNSLNPLFLLLIQIMT